MDKLRSVGQREAKMDDHMRTTKRKGLMTGPGSHFSQALSEKTAVQKLRSRFQQPGEQKTTASDANGNMTVGTTQAEGDFPAETIMQPGSEVSPDQRGQPPLRSSRDRSLGVHDRHSAAAAAAASAYFPKNDLAKRQMYPPDAPAEVAEEEVNVVAVGAMEPAGVVGEEYDQASWHDGEFIEGGGLSSALPMTSKIRKNEENVDIPDSMSSPAVISATEARAPAAARTHSPLRYETVVIGDTTGIPYMGPVEDINALDRNTEKAHTRNIVPVYLLAVQQAEAERLAEEEEAKKMKAAREGGFGGPILGYECAAWQAEAELGESAKLGEKKPFARDKYESMQKEKQQQEHFRETTEKREGMVAGLGQSPLGRQNDVKESAGKPDLPSEEFYEAPERPVAEQRQVPIHEALATEAPPGTSVPAAAPATAGVAAPAGGSSGTMPPAHAQEGPIRPSRAERRRADKEAKQRLKQQEKEEKERVKEEKKQQKDAVKRQLEERRSSQPAEERGNSKEGGLLDKLKRRMSGRPTDGGDSTGIQGGEAAASSATAGQEPEFITTAGNQTATAAP